MGVEAGLWKERVQQAGRDRVSGVADEAVDVAVAFSGSPGSLGSRASRPEAPAGWLRCRQGANFSMAAGVTGVKKLTRLPSGSRNRSERLPHGIVVGSLTKSSTNPARF
jgi:hypothetical protein